MSFFDTFMFLELLKGFCKAMKEIAEVATNPDTALWFWGTMLVTIIVMLIISY